MQSRMIPSLLALVSWLAAAAPAEAAPCPGGRISHVFIDNRSIFDLDDPDLNPRFTWAYELANSLHFQTREAVVRRILLFQPGDCYDPELIEESERVLRGYGFLATVDVFGLQQSDEEYHVVVYTRDEWSTLMDLSLGIREGLELRRLRLIESNLLGTGRSVELFHESTRLTREHGIAYWDPQLWGSRWQLRAVAGRSRAGSVLEQELVSPFLGEMGRWATRQSAHHLNRHFDFVIDGDAELSHLLLPVRRTGADFALVRRLGPRGRGTFIGSGIALRSIRFPGGADAIRLLDDNGDASWNGPDSLWTEPVLASVVEESATRLLFLLGHRRVDWLKRSGLDGLRGEEDVPVGVDAELTMAPPFPGSNGDRLFAGLGAFAGRELGSSVAAIRVRAEGHRTPAATEQPAGWTDVLAQGELLVYWKQRDQQGRTRVLRAIAAGGWRTWSPFQLTLGGEMGIRGYSADRFPGGRRVVVTVEDRFELGGPFRDVVSLGGAVFVDAGRMWAGDAPFGGDSGWRGAAGVSLRGAFPADSRTVYRLDLAVPVEGMSLPRALRVYISVGEPRGMAGRGVDPQLGRSWSNPLTGRMLRFPE